MSWVLLCPELCINVRGASLRTLAHVPCGMPQGHDYTGETQTNPIALDRLVKMAAAAIDRLVLTSE